VILIIYNKNVCNINYILEDFNYINPKLLFSLEHEKNNNIKFLDITVTRNTNCK